MSLNNIPFNATTTLALNLTQFTGTQQTNKNLLHWKTTNEINNRHFEIERSINGTIFTKIGVIQALNATRNNSYTYTDNNLVNNLYYYRLKIVDNNGNTKYSSIIKLSVLNAAFITAHPNPTKDVITISGLQNKGQLQITNMQGQVLQQVNVQGQSATINLSKYASGIYILKYNSNTSEQTLKVIKQ